MRDISALAAVPGLCMIQPCDSHELELALGYLLDVHEGSGYLRLCSMPFSLPFRLPDGHHLIPGRGASVRAGRDALITAYGPVMLSQAYVAAELLAVRHGIELEVVDMPWLNHVDGGWLAQLIGARRFLFTLDDHLLCGGQGQLIAASLLEAGAGEICAERFGVEGVPACGAPEAVLRAHGLHAEQLCERIARRVSEQQGMPQLQLRRPGSGAQLSM